MIVVVVHRSIIMVVVVAVMNVIVSVMGFDSHGLDPIVRISEHDNDDRRVVWHGGEFSVLKPVFETGVLIGHVDVLFETVGEVIGDPVGAAVTFS